MATTNLTRWRPFEDFGDVRTRLDRAFEDLVADGGRGGTPALDVIRNSDNLVVRANMPGVKPDEVKIQVSDDVLTVSGEHQEAKEEKEESFKDGVLEVTIPTPQAQKAAPIEIKAKAG
jgi:HSP20 family protein